jgi:hypothetical protein
LVGKIIGNLKVKSSRKKRSFEKTNNFERSILFYNGKMDKEYVCILYNY